ncbi:FGGY family carbohydrate kinase [Microbacterium sp. Kw_RZR3]|jgi:sugar (pentulose or hexulose) kinase|uniref:FGGY-family carbohydrate kinase n=1 Tax=Microbacterium sp. Kw_RZR3 TaxID=3032903 RepID=UPI0023DB52F4|nr:FGGY family carbohydrate kinase [Microbacterium sp. Kw_RZR3]MDF2047330.1 FGGY family carbohydrate kinase [Microbacterium sp. Kw_RZR3]
MSDYVVGIDMGSTSTKLLVATPEGHQVLVVSRRSPWTNLDHGRAEMTAAQAISVVHELAAEADARLDEGYRIVALGVSGMAEAGVLLDAEGTALAPIMAWFDPRGAAQIIATPDAFRAEFPGRTGLPVGPLASIAKLLHLRDNGIALVGTTFLNVPEYVVHALGGPRVAEYSLVSRTGLIDQDDSTPWRAALDVLGVDASILGKLVSAGEAVGTLSDPGMPAGFRGAALTIAGHDHLVSAVAVGATHTGQLYDSMGTAEALVRVLDDTLPFAARERLAHAGINCVRHVIPSKYVLLAGTKSGLLMRRVLQLLGITDAVGRARIDDETMALPALGTVSDAGLAVSGARNDDGVLKIVAQSDGLSPAELFAAALRHGNDMLAEYTAVMDREVEPPTSTVLTGGWSSMASVVRSRSALLPEVTVSTHDEGTAYGAALFAAFAVSSSSFEDVAEAFLSSSLLTTERS